MQTYLACPARVGFWKHVPLKKININGACDGLADRNTTKWSVHRNHDCAYSVERVRRATVRLFVHEVARRGAKSVSTDTLTVWIKTNGQPAQSRLPYSPGRSKMLDIRDLGLDGANLRI